MSLNNEKQKSPNRTANNAIVITEKENELLYRIYEQEELGDMEEDPIHANKKLDPSEAKKALVHIMPKLKAIPASQIRPLRISAPRAVGTGLAYAEYFANDRKLFEKAFTKEAFDVADYDDMEERAKAFWHADIVYRKIDPHQGPLRGLTEEVRRLRAKLLDAASYLWKDHPSLSYNVSQIRSGTGRANYADDLGALVELFQENWNEANGHCNVTEEDLAKAEAAGLDMFRAISIQKREELAELRNIRALAGEYLRRGIEDIRAGATFVHRDNDIALECYVSMFFLGNKRRRTNGNGKSNETVADSAVVSTPPEIPMATPVELDVTHNVS